MFGFWMGRAPITLSLKGRGSAVAIVALLLPAPSLAQTYVESPLFAQKVATGQFPPVAERLPKQPIRVDLEARGRRVGQPGGEVVTLVPRARDIRYLSAYAYTRLVGYDDALNLKADILESIDVQGEDRIFTRGEVRAQLGLGRSVSEEAVDASPAPLRLTSDAIWVGKRKITRAEFARAAGADPAAVRIVPGSVWRNGVMLCESYVAEDPGYKYPLQIVPPGHLFVMGDNRNQSADSHEWGMLPEGRVIGRADLVFWPPSNAKRIVHDHGSSAEER